MDERTDVGGDKIILNFGCYEITFESQGLIFTKRCLEAFLNKCFMDDFWGNYWSGDVEIRHLGAFTYFFCINCEVK